MSALDANHSGLRGAFLTEAHEPGGSRRSERKPAAAGCTLDRTELQLLLLGLIDEQPRQGHELIEAAEELCGGHGAPGPAEVYPMLLWLIDTGLAAIETLRSGRRRHRLAPEGRRHLATHRTAVDELLSRLAQGAGPRLPAAVVTALDNLQLAIRLRLRRQPLDAAAIDGVAAALYAAAQAAERC